MTAAQILERVNSLRPNPYGNYLSDYLKSFETRVQTELFFMSEPVYDQNNLVLSETDPETYELYLFSVIDLLNGEYGRYDNSSSAFNKAYSCLCKKAMQGKSNPERRLKIWNK